MKKITRRDLLKMSAIGGAGAVLAACAPAAAPMPPPLPVVANSRFSRGGPTAVKWTA